MRMIAHEHTTLFPTIFSRSVRRGSVFFVGMFVPALSLLLLGSSMYLTSFSFFFCRRYGSVALFFAVGRCGSDAVERSRP